MVRVDFGLGVTLRVEGVLVPVVVALRVDFGLVAAVALSRWLLVVALRVDSDCFAIEI